MLALPHLPEGTTAMADRAPLTTGAGGAANAERDVRGFAQKF
jgi:hypothetical protein